MAPKVARTQSPCETGEGISAIRRLLNNLHCLWAGLHTELFFEEGGVHFLGLAWTSQVPTSMSLRSSQAALIILVDSTYEYKAIFLWTDIHKPRLPHSFCFLNHFIIICVCFGINYHDFVGFRINVKDFGRTYVRKLCYGGKDYRGVF
ncbi:DNA-directed RNA polymerases II, IV and V subunit 3-like [Pyrus ussuriensis x Pyrus communis]|uniref:DNA-directed RNA polymerases II, IV and V subunit 3-like n=1 Tax=Pyrus ussuriensis x Pyrus communis TaxID=2448454 RepID=A0A5N5FN78_9ROSA|nr:DNA-directed RNA polymerases II, IV and V subunit 3-like [Pyrus ussuriensis x Pyrus communis]